MHRNTAVVILFLGIFAAIVVGTNLGKKPEKTQPPASVISPTIAPSIASYTSTSCGISFSYPNYLTKLDSQDGGTTFINEKDAKDTIVVTCREDIPRVPLPIDKIETLKIGSVSANLYHDASQKDGSPIDKLIFTHPTIKNKDVYLAGFGETFNNLIKTLKIN